MEAIEVRWRLDRPLVEPARPIHLDALLAWARVDEALEAGEPDPEKAQDDLPLERHHYSNGWVWCASWLYIIPAGPVFLQTMTRHINYVTSAYDQGRRFSGGPSRYTPGSGPYKWHILHIPLRPVREVRAWAVGNPDRLRALLERVTHLGAERRLGYGHIATWTLRTVRPDACPWYWRSLPEPHPALDCVQVEGTLNPPYWDRTRRYTVWEPLSPPTLSEDAAQ